MRRSLWILGATATAIGCSMQTESDNREQSELTVESAEQALRGNGRFSELTWFPPEKASVTDPGGASCNGPDGLAAPVFGLPDMQDILGKVQFYSQPQNFGLLFSNEWTNWYYDNLTTGLAKLATNARRARSLQPER